MDASVTHNAKGEITLFKGNNLAWTDGKLSAYKSYTFKYGVDGQRIYKGKIDGNTYQINYLNDEESMFKEKRSDGKTLTFIRGVSGIIGFKYDNKLYYYRKNNLGDVIELYYNGNVEAKYAYDAWGNHVVLNPNGTTNTSTSFIGNINPIRYRGYYYDVETQLYYCNSRYYSPELCRWISPDSIEYLDPESINGLNLYCYCGNNPVNYSDGSGHFPILCTLLFLGGLGALTSIASQAVIDIMYGNEFDINNYLIAAGAGFLGGLCYAVPVAGGFLASAVTSGLTTAGQMIYSGEDYSVEDYIINIGMSAVIGGLTSVAFGKATSKLSYFADTDFFLSNLVKFAGNHGGITLQNSVINQLMGQLIVRGVVIGTISNMFGSIFQEIPSKSSDYFHLRKMGLNRCESFRYAFF